MVLVALGAFAVISGVAYCNQDRPSRPQVTIAQREAIEAQAEAEDERMDAIAANHKVLIGMHAAQCRDAWSAPISVRTAKTSGGISQEWVYSNGTLYFENGILRAIQQ